MLRARTILCSFLLLLIGLPEQRTGAQGSGDPSLAYPYRATLGQTGLPWLRSNALLDQPWGLAGDREGVWIANAAGRNLLRFGAGMVEELGRAGSIDGLPGHRLRFPADLAVVQHETLPQGTTGFPLRTVWIVDRDAHAVVGLPLDHEGLPGEPRILGRPDQPGDDDAHLRWPVGVAADDEGRVYVSDGGNHRVQIFAPDGRLVATIGRPETRSADVALVIDSSGSMAQTTSPGGPTKLDAAREAARSFLGQMQAGRDQASLIQFNQSARVLAPLGGDIAAVSAALDRIAQDNGTRIDLALALAGQQLQGLARKAENNAVLILLTDGEPSGTTPEEVRAEADAVKAAGILIFTIGLGRELDVDLLQSMASRPDWYYAAPDTSDLAAIYERIAYEIPCRPDWP